MVLQNNISLAGIIVLGYSEQILPSNYRLLKQWFKAWTETSYNLVSLLQLESWKLRYSLVVILQIVS